MNSLESDKLERLIKSKTERLKKLQETDPENVAIQYLNSEITFLRDTIMPIILQNTTVDYSEIRDFVTNTLRQVERSNYKKITDLVIHIRFKEPEKGKSPVAAYKSTLENVLQFIPEITINNVQALLYPL